MQLTKDDLKQALLEQDQRNDLKLKAAVGILDAQFRSVGDRVSELRDQVGIQNGRVRKNEGEIATLTERITKGRTADTSGQDKHEDEVTVSFGGKFLRSLVRPAALPWLITALVLARDLIAKAYTLFAAAPK